MEFADYHALGSIVVVKGNSRKVIIIARGLLTDIGGGVKFFDYGGCLYPDGLIGDAILYFNHKDIDETVFEGFSDHDNEITVKNLHNWLAENNVEYGNPLEINKKNKKSD